MTNPYFGRPEYAFWRLAVSSETWNRLDPMVDYYPIIDRQTRVASAGSCFAQHVAKYISTAGYNYLVTENKAGEAALFSARYGNIYTTRQLRQLIQRVYGEVDCDRLTTIWRRPGDGLWVDAFRPTAADPFPDPEAAETDRRVHLARVKILFETMDVFIFTLGLTECWGNNDGLIFPAAPGVMEQNADMNQYQFHNFTVAEIVDDFNIFMRLLRSVNPRVKVILTISPVPLRATYEDSHILVANCYSKSVLRAAAGELSDPEDGIFYFPSYEIFTGVYTGGRLYRSDLREVTPAGVNMAMAWFLRHFARGGGQEADACYVPVDYDDVICDAS